MQSLIHFFVAGGWVMYPLALLSLAAVAVIIERWLAFRTLADLAPDLVEDVVQLCTAGDAEEALALAKNRKGPVAAVLAEVLTHREKAVDDVERHVQEVGEPYFIELEHRLPLLDTATTISPLLGLLGTLFGMIATFRAIAAAKSEGANDSILAGVGEALYATATGLTIAVVCFIAYNFFSAKTRQTVAQTEQAATRLINVLRQSGQLSRSEDEAAHAVRAVS
jgi:biopolymer transport protein ExbB